MFRKLKGGIDPQGSRSVSDRLIRGGSRLHRPPLARSALRRWRAPGDRNDRLGFRLARVPGSPEPLTTILTPSRSLDDPGAHVLAVAWQEEKVYTLAYSPDGKVLAAV